MAEDNYSKIVLAVVGIVFVFSLILLLLPKPYSKVGEAFSIAQASGSGIASTALGDRGTTTKTTVNWLDYYKYTYTYTFTWSPDPPKCPGSHDLTGKANLKIEDTKSIPSCSGSAKNLMAKTVNGLCDSLTDAMGNFCKYDLCRDKTGVAGCTGQLLDTTPPDTCKSTNNGDCTADTDELKKICQCYIPEPKTAQVQTESYSATTGGY